MTSKEFFGNLNGTEFKTFRELQAAVLDQFNRNLEQFPSHYSYIQLIDWAKRNRWIVSSDGQGFRIEVNA